MNALRTYEPNAAPEPERKGPPWFSGKITDNEFRARLLTKTLDELLLARDGLEVCLEMNGARIADGERQHFLYLSVKCDGRRLRILNEHLTALGVDLTGEDFSDPTDIALAKIDALLDDFSHADKTRGVFKALSSAVQTFMQVRAKVRAKG